MNTFAEPHHWPIWLLLFVVGGIASGINSVAGGGSLVSFPLLVSLGIPPLTANATNSVGLWPGSLAGAFGFREQLSATKQHLKTLFLPTLIGTTLGSWLLIQTGEQVFKAVVPGLILMATLLLWFQPNIKNWANRRDHKVSPTGALLMQGLVAAYGGYFGAGMGIMMLATFGLYIPGNVHQLNAVKTWLGVVINLSASVIFITKGMVLAAPAICLTLGSLVGGFWAARASLKLDSDLLRKLIAGFGFCLALHFAYQAFF